MFIKYILVLWLFMWFLLFWLVLWLCFCFERLRRYRILFLRKLKYWLGLLLKVFVILSLLKVLGWLCRKLIVWMKLFEKFWSWNWKKCVVFGVFFLFREWWLILCGSLFCLCWWCWFFIKSLVLDNWLCCSFIFFLFLDCCRKLVVYWLFIVKYNCCWKILKRLFLFLLSISLIICMILVLFWILNLIRCCFSIKLFISLFLLVWILVCIMVKWLYLWGWVVLEKVYLLNCW